MFAVVLKTHWQIRLYFQTLILAADLSFLGSYAVPFGEQLATFQRIPAPEKYR